MLNGIGSITLSITLYGYFCDAIYCVCSVFYISILLEYLNGADEKKANLKSFLDSGDFKDYGILIHSIKSTSAMIGATVPFKLAQDLEAAAGKDDKGYVLSNHDGFLKEYNTVPAEDPDGDIDFGDDGVMEFLPEGD